MRRGPSRSHSTEANVDSRSASDNSHHSRRPKKSCREGTMLQYTYGEGAFHNHSGPCGHPISNSKREIREECEMDIIVQRHSLKEGPSDDFLWVLHPPSPKAGSFIKTGLGTLLYLDLVEASRRCNNNGREEKR
mmetsp:Transcript_14569/g.33660  ORF Transcript_14569/g.33660 Transcript_14569/m.33660 type:complete len:134 (+) Transcript_14569:872-1273(+)